MPGAEAIAAFYREDLKHFDPYIAQRAVHRAYFRKKMQEIKKLASPSTLLDIGCAMGILLEEAKRAGVNAFGVDISRDAVTFCRRKGLTASQTYPKRRFDVVTAFEVIEHERDPVGFMRRVYKLLNKGGVVVLTTPDHSGIWQKLMGRHWVSYQHPEHVTFWENESLRYLLTKSGFSNITVRRDSPRPFPLSFLFTRAADYFPWAAWILKPIGRVLARRRIVNPINPWDDLLVVGKK
ncbi:hypothetical protein A2363_04455 [Candidatus Gottesmanbacteria bacterium RIFOXYB1_FULL_47_11]|uniref:Methyltransferase type 11 domain-containing protein n=1 Tax=Candidatus Gottesmanbacteria bacterium RIFOXYB1_FULL_47_11 TaxID=1798401 RepID=A0A1F6BFU9_9BACT|nr:MAG: hypothetical protein A2363_04455 [Candidatus Gottesmanbacteria bacterium RIFOXYB1_FULL_47_11]